MYLNVLSSLIQSIRMGCTRDDILLKLTEQILGRDSKSRLGGKSNTNPACGILKAGFFLQNKFPFFTHTKLPVFVFTKSLFLLALDQSASYHYYYDYDDDDDDYYYDDDYCNNNNNNDHHYYYYDCYYYYD